MFRFLRDKFQISSNKLIFLATIYFNFVLNWSFWNYIIKNVDINGFNMILFIISSMIITSGVLYIVFNILIVKYIGKPILIILLLVSSCTNYLMFKFGVYIDKDMVRNLFQTNTREAFDFFTLPFVLSLLITGILPAFLLCITKIEYKVFSKELKQRIISVLLAILLISIAGALSYKELVAFGRNNKKITRLINTSNYIYATFRYIQAQIKTNRTFVILDKDAKLTPFEDDMPTLVVFVVGETARAKNFSLYGYEKQTNPLLSKQDLAVFEDVSSCGTATAISVPCIFSDKMRRKFNADEAMYTENLIDLAQQSGYDVVWLENDDGCKGVCKRIYNESMVQKNNPKYCDGIYCKDEVLIYDLEDRISNITKDTLIILHTMGSHGPTYYKRYPDEFKVFTPTCDTQDIQTCSKDEIINTYDNTIIYTDFIISSAIDILKKFPNYESGLFYVSDHGESLGENNIYLHGFPYKFAPEEQTQIPMFLWMSESMKKYDHIDYECLKEHSRENSYSHDNIFHSMIGLLEIKTKLYEENLDFFAKCRTKKLMGYE